MREKLTLDVLGVLALASYAIHGTYHLTRGFPANLLWTCQPAHEDAFSSRAEGCCEPQSSDSQ